MKKLESIHINITKAFDKTLGTYYYKGKYFKEFTLILYFFEITFHICYREKYVPNLQWSKEEREILEKQNKSPLKINRIKEKK